MNYLNLHNVWSMPSVMLRRNDFYVFGNQLRCHHHNVHSWLVKDCDSPDEAVATLLLIKVLPT